MAVILDNFNRGFAWAIIAYGIDADNKLVSVKEVYSGKSNLICGVAELQY